jgi:hypothetical protein
MALERPRKKKLWALWHFLVAGLLVSGRVQAQTKPVKPLKVQTIIPTRAPDHPKAPDSLLTLVKPLIGATINANISPTTLIRMGAISSQIPKPRRKDLATKVPATYDTTGKDSIKYDVLAPITVAANASKQLGDVILFTRVTYFTDILKDSVNNLLATAGVTCKQFNIYPNPAARGTVINLSLASVSNGRWRVGLFTAAGALVQEKYVEVSGKSQAELWNVPASLPGGIYFVKMDRPDTGERYMKKLLVQ